jgi:hypothetical protein
MHTHPPTLLLALAGVLLMALGLAAGGDRTLLGLGLFALVGSGVFAVVEMYPDGGTVR